MTLLEPAGKLYEYLEGFGKLLAGCETLFIVDDIIADDCLDKKRNSLLELAISGRHRHHSLWFLTQSYTAVPKNIRRQVKMLYVWKPKNRNDLFTIYEENDIINSKEDLEKIKKELKCEKYNCLVLRSEHPESYHIIKNELFLQQLPITLLQHTLQQHSTTLLQHSYNNITVMKVND